MSAPDTTRYAPIGDYALIGDCRGAALVSRGGAVVLRDLMPVASEEDKRRALTPDHQVLREVEGLSGDVEVEILYAPRPDYGRSRPRLEERGALGLWCETNGAALTLHSELPLALTDGGRAAVGRPRVSAGQRAHVALAYSREAPQVLPPLPALASGSLDRSARWWRSWAGRAAYQGPYREAVVRSALVLKLMAYAPSGAVVAAPTTSLPEKLGGARNWDYRYCWLRDASFTLRALFELGYDEEALAFLSWMLHATRLTWPELQVLYDVFGEARLPERELTHLEGYAGSGPVRIGNDAHGQLQLDVYGEVIDAVARFARRGGRFDRDTAWLLDGLGHTVCRRWREPDEGIWEGRSGRFHHTHSKVLCWVALDRLIQMHEAGQLVVRVDEFRAQRAAIRAAVEAHGYNERLASYTRTFNGEEMDASLLVLPLYGYRQATHPRMRSTCSRIREKLARDELVYRYETATDDGLPPGEGAFGICSFWAVECVARGGDVEGATRAIEQLLAHANDVGLFAEEIDPDTGAALGNFPQAFTHIGLINAALTLAEYSDEHTFAGRDLTPAEKELEDHT